MGRYSDRPPITPEQSAAMLAEAQRRQAEFDAWVAEVLAGGRPFDRDQLTAWARGVLAGANHRPGVRRRSPYLGDAYRLVAWCAGYGAGRAAMPGELGSGV